MDGPGFSALLCSFLVKPRADTFGFVPLVLVLGFVDALTPGFGPALRPGFGAAVLGFAVPGFGAVVLGFVMPGFGAVVLGFVELRPGLGAAPGVGLGLRPEGLGLDAPRPPAFGAGAFAVGFGPLLKVSVGFFCGFSSVRKFVNERMMAYLFCCLNNHAMPESTNLNVSPYFDDFSPNSQYYKVLFQPGVSVQVRELNVLQSTLQNQVEQFGDNILTKGTIVSGCSFQFYPVYPYLKLKDNDLFSVPVIPSNLVGFFAESTNTGLRAFITSYADGFESQNPDLKTLFITYINGGTDNDTHVFNPGEIIEITDANVALWSVNVVSSGISFSNSDFPVFTSALIVNVTTGSFSNGDFVSQPSTGANLQVINIDSSSLALDGQTILYLSPRNTDLANAAVNSNAWAVANNDSISNLGNTAVATVLSVVGTNASGTVLTDGSGRILQVPLGSGGFGYDRLPTVRIRSIGNPTGLAAANLIAQNFLTKVIAANTADAAGNGYAFGVGEGVIYQKGYFLRVNPQTVVVDKYDVTPNNISVGFHSIESIITPEQDPNLFDNALGTQNFQAPGADRLQIVPTLVTSDPSSTTGDFFPIVSWSEGNPYLQRQDTSYGVLGAELARRQYETTGNFSIDQFNIQTRSPTDRTLEGNTFSVVVDPGTAYIDGYRVKTVRNFVISDRKGVDTNAVSNVSISLCIGDWLPLANVGGIFQFSTGDTVKLYDTAKGFIGNGSLVGTANVQPVGTQIGTARMRGFELASGFPGDATAVYRLYLFSIQMNQGKSFSNVLSVFYNGSIANGVADVVQGKDSTGNAATYIGNTEYDSLVFDAGIRSVQSVNNVTYNYRTLDQTLAFANTGRMSKTLTGSEYWPYANGTVLSAAQQRQQYVVPFGKSMQASANLAGTVTVNTSVTTLTGSTTTFLSDIVPGDWVYIFSNSTVHDVRRIVSVANNTVATLDAVSTIAETACGLYRYFPQYVPIPFGVRAGLTANLDSSGQVLTFDVGFALAGSTTCNTALVSDVQRLHATPGTKTAARSQYVVIKTANATNTTLGPWCLGISDVIRLRAVYRTQSTPPFSSTTGMTEVTGSFFVDQRQTQDYVDLSYLFLKPGNALGLTTSDYLVAKIDCFQVSSAGYYSTQTYVGSDVATVQTTDSLPLANLGSSISSWEVPFCYSQDGSAYDLLAAFDFRPIAVNTATSTSTLSAASINPVTTLSFGNTADPTANLKFPKPDSVLKLDLTYYCGRKDAVYLSHDSSIFIGAGQPGGPLPNQPANTMLLGHVYIPPYPCLPAAVSNTMGEVITLRTLNENKRLRARTIITPGNQPAKTIPDQPRGYSMRDIQSLDDRIRSLEYYVGLSSLQTDLVNKVIPSGNDPTITRFKYGFFVDNFTSGVSQDVDDPQYAASIKQTALTPQAVSWAVKHAGGLSAYVDFAIVTQNTATGNAALVSNAAANGWLLRVDADSTGSLVAANSKFSNAQLSTFIASGGQFNFNFKLLAQGTVNLNDYESARFASNASLASFYFYVPKTTVQVTNVVFSGADPDAFTIYQGNTILFHSNNAVALTAADVSYLQSNSVPGGWFQNTQLVANNLTKSGTGNNFVSGSGKITWTHNPALGNDYTVYSQRLSKFDHWRWALNYPAPAPTVAAPSTLSNGVVSYVGVMQAQPTTFLLSLNPSSIGSLITLGGGIAADANARIFQYVGKVGNSGAPTFYIQNPDGSTGSVISKGASTGWGEQQTKTWAGAGAKPYNTSLQPQGYGITCWGLKPNTKHVLKVGGVDQSAFCRPFGGNLGDNLLTDATGVISFNFFYQGGVAQQSVTSQLLSNTAPIQASVISWTLGSSEQPIGDGQIMFSLEAPNSLAQYIMQVAASPEIPLNLLKPSISPTSRSG